MLVLQYVLYGLSTGAVYAMLACGLILAFRASGYLDFSHPYVGMVATLVYVMVSDSLGVAPALVIALAVGAGLAAGIYTGIYSRLARGPLGPKVVMSLAVGLSLQFVGGVFFIRWGDDLLGGASKRSVLPQSQLGFLPDSLALTFQQAFLHVVALAVLAGLAYLVGRTDFGLALRACAQNPLSAVLAGLPRRAVEIGAWSLTGVVAAAAGVFALSSQSFLIPTYLFDESIRGFAAALAGGFVDFKRAVIAALLIGVVENQLVGAGGVLEEMRGAVTFALVTLVALVSLSSRRGLSFGRIE